MTVKRWMWWEQRMLALPPRNAPSGIGAWAIGSTFIIG